MSRKSAPKTRIAKSKGLEERSSSDNRRPRARQPADDAALSDRDLDAVSGGVRATTGAFVPGGAIVSAAVSGLRDR